RSQRRWSHGDPGSSACTCGCPFTYSSSADRATEGLDPVARGQRHDCALGVLALAPPELGALALALAVARFHRQNLDAEDLLNSDLDVRLVGVRVNQERVLVLIQQAIALLRDDRLQDDVARVREAHAAHLSSSVLLPRNSFRASTVKTTSSLTSTS